jgi:spermidine synthase
MTTDRWLLAAYASSGFAGLVYEIAWTRLLTLHLGHTTAAVSTVTAAFMGGLGLGAALGGRLAPRLSRQQALWTYALLELVVVLASFAIAPSLRLLAPMFAWAYGEDGSGSLFSTMRIASSLAMLLVPGIALGATFPMAVRVAVAGPARPGWAAGRLYAVNTAGAAIGSLAAGFFLIPILGLAGAMLAGMAASAGSIALALSFRRGVIEGGATTTAAPQAQNRRRNRLEQRQSRTSGQRALADWDIDRQRFGLAAAALVFTGFSTFVYEVVWTRVLAMSVGPSIYAFAATLTSFITGLALGSLAGAFLADRTRRPSVALALTLIATAAAACISIGAIGGSTLDRVPDVSGRATDLAGIVLPHLTFALSLTLPIALGLGVAFPLSLELAGGRDAIPARQSGILYAVNTAASVAGALVAGFVAIPAIGLHGSLVVATTSLLLGAAILVVRSSLSFRGRLVVLVPLLAVVVWTSTSPDWDREWQAAGAYLYSRFVPPGLDRRTALTAGTLLYYREGASGTVSVKALTGVRSLSIDGKVDASTGRDMLTQKLLAHLPLLLHPNPRQVGIVGLGSGVTLASALVYPVASVDVVEISPEVIEASTHFAEVNGRALEDVRTHLVRGDGRTHLSFTSRRYDVVISEPSNPWMAGVAALFTQEFFKTVHGRLAPGGIFCQWAHTYDVSDTDLRSIVATFRSVFPDGLMWLAGDGDLLLLGSTAPLEPRLESISTAWQQPGVGEDLRSVGMQEPFALLSLFAGGAREMSKYGAEAVVQTDDRTALEFSGPLAVFATGSSNHAATLRAQLDDGQRPAAVARALMGATASQWRDRGSMLIEAEAFDSAYRDYARALDLASADEATLDGFVRAAIAARQQDDAERRLRALIQSRGSEPALRVSLAQLLGTGGRYDEAIAVAAEATTLAAADPAPWEQLASLYADRGDVAGLGRAAEVLRRESPGRAATWYFAASESFLRGDPAASLLLVRRAIEMDPRYADAHNLLGAIYATAGDFAAGRDAFQTSLRLDPRDAITYVNLAQLEVAAGRRDVAADLFTEALSLDPNSAPAREGLAQAKRVR